MTVADPEPPGVDGDTAAYLAWALRAETSEHGWTPPRRHIAVVPGGVEVRE